MLGIIKIKGQMACLLESILYEPEKFEAPSGDS
jgi:hypothetical protein